MHVHVCLGSESHAKCFLFVGDAGCTMIVHLMKHKLLIVLELWAIMGVFMLPL